MSQCTVLDRKLDQNLLLYHTSQRRGSYAASEMIRVAPGRSENIIVSRLVSRTSAAVAVGCSMLEKHSFDFLIYEGNGTLIRSEVIEQNTPSTVEQPRETEGACLLHPDAVTRLMIRGDTIFQFSHPVTIPYCRASKIRLTALRSFLRREIAGYSDHRGTSTRWEID